MLLTFVARDFFVATWEVDPEAVARTLPDGLEPALSDRGSRSGRCRRVSQRLGQARWAQDAVLLAGGRASGGPSRGRPGRPLPVAAGDGRRARRRALRGPLPAELDQRPRGSRAVTRARAGLPLHAGSARRDGTTNRRHRNRDSRLLRRRGRSTGGAPARRLRLAARRTHLGGTCRARSRARLRRWRTASGRVCGEHRIPGAAAAPRSCHDPAAWARLPTGTRSRAKATRWATSAVPGRISAWPRARSASGSTESRCRPGGGRRRRTSSSPRRRSTTCSAAPGSRGRRERPTRSARTTVSCTSSRSRRTR